MKKISKLIIVITIASLYSCEDAYDITQVGLLESQNAVQSVADVESNLIGAYGYLDNTTEIQFNGVYTDEFGIGNTNGGQNLDELGLVLTAASQKPEDIWANNYIALSRVNKVIQNAANVTPENDAEQARYDVALGQAYALRAYLHLKLQTYFSADLTDNNALGVIALSHVPETDEFLPRSTNLAVYNLMESDLNRAETLLTGAASSGVTYVNIDVVNAIRARMYTYRGDYINAATYAAPLLASYPISDTATFASMFRDDTDGEVIFKLERTIGDSYDEQGDEGLGYAGSLFSFVDASVTGGLFLEMGRSLFNKLSTSDVRYNTYVHPTSIIDPNYLTSTNYRETDVLAINKYAGSEGQNLMNDIKIFRGSEMLFILAEAAAVNGNNLLGAATLIKQLRDARFGSAQVLPVYTNEQEAFADILAERRLELAFEGHRWVDLKRLGVVANVTIDKDPLDCAITGGCTMLATDHRFVAPIPLRELDINGSLSQNPNY